MRNRAKVAMILTCILSPIVGACLMAFVLSYNLHILIFVGAIIIYAWLAKELVMELGK